MGNLQELKRHRQELQALEAKFFASYPLDPSDAVADALRQGEAELRHEIDELDEAIRKLQEE